MNLKKIFWWRYHPADEREQVLYQKAYEVSLSWLVSLLTVFCILVIADFRIGVRMSDTPSYLVLFLLGAIILCYTRGAGVLWKEEIFPPTEDEKKEMRKMILSYIVILVVAVVAFMLLGWRTSYERLPLAFVTLLFLELSRRSLNSKTTDPAWIKKIQQYTKK